MKRRFDNNTNTKMVDEIMLKVNDYLYEDLSHYIQFHPRATGYDLSNIDGVKINFSSDMSLYSYFIDHPGDFEEYVVGIFTKDDDIYVFMDVVYDDFPDYQYLDNGIRLPYYDDDIYDHVALIIVEILAYRCYL